MSRLRFVAISFAETFTAMAGRRKAATVGDRSTVHRTPTRSPKTKAVRQGGKRNLRHRAVIQPG